MKKIIISLICVTLGTLVVGYLLQPALSLPGYLPGNKVGPQPSGTIAVPLILSFAIVATIGLVLTITSLIGEKNRKHKKLLLAFNVAYTAAWCLLCYGMFSNFFGWKNFQQKPLLTEIRAEQATPEETQAAETYLKIVTNEEINTEEFFSQIHPLLKIENWVFTAKDTTNYNIFGISGTPEDNPEIWEAIPKLGTARTQSIAILKLAEKDAQEGNLEAAAQKVTTVLGIANRVADHPVLITYYIGRTLTDLALETLQKYPEIVAASPEIQKELARAKNLEEKEISHYLEELRIQDRMVQRIAINPKTKEFQVTALVVPPQFMERRKDDILKATLAGNEAMLAYQQRVIRESWLSGQPINAILLGISLPGTNLKTNEAQKKTRAIEALLQTTQSS